MSLKFADGLVALAAVAGLTSSLASAIVIPTVPIGNPGNAPDPLTGGLYGSVAYTYNIGTTEVTNAQYVAFLNAVGATDTNDLYRPDMSGPFGGIDRSGSPGSYTYATVGGRDNNPVNYVSFWNATRFANWLHNGQPSGAQNNSTTEDGAYSLTSDGISANTIARNADARWALTSEDEWYKAAYHQPANAAGDPDSFWLFPTSANSISTAQANYLGNGIFDTAPVGSYAANYFGTFDMGGNLWEWNEAIILGSSRGVRGGFWRSQAAVLGADFRSAGVNPAETSGYGIGFRVSQIPSPPSAAILAACLMGAMIRRRGDGR